MKLPFHRTRLWIDPGFQGRQLLRSLFHLLFFATLVWLLGYILQAAQMALGHHAATGRGATYTDPIPLNTPIPNPSTLCLPLIVLGLLRSSHRVAGPLFRCRQIMLEMAKG